MKKLLLLVLAVLCIGAFESQATHMMGADVYYKCKSPGVYEITLKIYRDCTGVQLGTPTFNVSCGSYSNSESVTKVGVKDITPTCAGAVSACKNQQTGLGIGVEVHTFTKTLDFNKAPYSTWKKNGCCEFKFSWGQCCRNGEITTYPSGSFYAEAMINLCNIDKTKKKCNTAPELTSDPIAFLCCAQPYYFNNGALDLDDYDSLSYSLVSPMSAAGTNMTPNTPFTATNPMTVRCPPGPKPCKAIPGAKPPLGFFLDPNNGDIVFTPMKCDEVGLVVIQIKEWRKDSSGKYVHIGTTRRDMQMVVINCGPNDPPRITSSLGTKNSMSVCEGDKVKITIYGKDQPPLTAPNGKKDTVLLGWNNGIPAGKFKILNPSSREKTAEFTWQTKIGDAKDAAYTFTVYAEDDACPLKASASRAYSIKVKPKATGDRIYTLLKCGKLEYKAKLPEGFGHPASYLWNIFDSLNPLFPIHSSVSSIDTFHFKQGGTYYFSLNLNNRYDCENVYRDTVHIPEQLKIELAFGPDTFVCAGKKLDVEPLVANGKNPLSFEWRTPEDHTSGDTLSKFTMQPSSDTSLFLLITDGDGCQDSALIDIEYKPNPIVDIGPDIVLCTYEDTMFDAGHADTMFYLWAPTADTSRIIRTNLDASYSVIVTDSFGCKGYDTALVIVNDTVKPFAGPDSEICLRDSLFLIAGGTPLADIDFRTFIWTNKNTNNVIGTDSVEILTPKVDECYELRMDVTQNGKMCWDVDSTCNIVNPLPDLTTEKLDPYCYNEGQFNLSGATGAHKDIVFHCDSSGVVKKVGSSWIFYIDALAPPKPKLDKYIKVYKERTNPVTGCFDRDSIFVIIRANPVVNINDRTFCQDIGEVDLNHPNSRIINLPTNLGSGTQTWTELGTSEYLDVRDPFNFLDKDYWLLTLYPDKNKLKDVVMEFKFTEISSDGFGCTGRDTAIFKIVEVPTVEFTPIPKICINDDTVDLDDYVNLNFGEWTVTKYDNKTEAESKLDYSSYIIDDHLFDPSISDQNFGRIFHVNYKHTASGCLTQDSTEFWVYPLPQFEPVTIPPLCNTDDPYALFADIKNSNKESEVVWSGPFVNGSEFDPRKIESDTAIKDIYGPFTIKYSYYNATTTCSNNDSTEIRVQIQPEVDIVKPLDGAGLCEGTNFILNAEHKFDNGITWSTYGSGTFTDPKGVNTEYDPSLKDDTARAVTLKVITDPYGPACPQDSQEVSVVIEPIPSVGFTFPDSSCMPLITDVRYAPPSGEMLPNLAFEWDLDDGKTDTTQDVLGIVYPKEGDYTVKLVVRNMNVADGTCADSLEIPNYKKVWPIPTAKFIMNPDSFTTIALPEFKIRDTSTISPGYSIDKYEWDFDLLGVADLSDSVQYPTGRFNVVNYGTDTLSTCIKLVVTSDFGCTDSTVKCLTVGPDVTVYIPNAFTPNGAGPHESNTFWVAVQGHTHFNIKVFNRWGEMLFNSNEATVPELGWDGTYNNGELVQQGAFMYVCEVIGFDGETYVYKGTVTLLR